MEREIVAEDCYTDELLQQEMLYHSSAPLPGWYACADDDFDLLLLCSTLNAPRVYLHSSFVDESFAVIFEF